MPDTDRMVIRCAPRWAWETIDATLDCDAHANSFDPALRIEISDALKAMTELDK